MAFPLTIFTRSLRTTRPGKCSLILLFKLAVIVKIVVVSYQLSVFSFMDLERPTIMAESSLVSLSQSLPGSRGM